MKTDLLLLFSLFVCFCDASTWVKPSFCKDNDCPIYTVIRNNSKYEVRSYEPSYWVQTRSDRQAFWRLFSYISGSNNLGMKMPMTSPVLRLHTQVGVVMSFMIPYSLSGRAPAPTDSRVSLYTLPARQYYVKYGRGYDWYNSAAKLAELRRDLAADNILVSGDNYYVAGYDGPRVYYMNRYHEIWIGVL